MQQPLPYQPGVYAGIKDTVYHGLTQYCSKSYLWKLGKTPAAARIIQPDVPVLQFGRAAHTLLLEGWTHFQNCYAALPPGLDRRTSLGKAAYTKCMEENAGKDFISGDDFSKLLEMQEAVRNHPFASKLLEEGQSEQTVIWKDLDSGLWCKCRPDRIPIGDKGILVDLKTCANADEYNFSRDVVKYGYAVQAAFYLDGMNAVTAKAYDAFCFVAVSKEAPYQTEVYMLDEEFLEYGRNEYRRLINIELACRQTGIYPNYVNPTIVVLSKPGYL